VKAFKHVRTRVQRDGQRGVQPDGQRGVALIIALLAMSLLTVLVVEFTFSMRVDLARTHHWMAAKKANLLAETGIQLAAQLLALDERMSIADTNEDIWAKPFPALNTETGTILLRIEDENGRINLNRLASGARSLDGRRYSDLLLRLGLDEQLTGTLADWLDRNDVVTATPEGAEQDWYGELEPPYEPRNGPLYSFAELALVKGYDAAALRALRPFTAVLEGTEQTVNINTAPEDVLRALDPRLDDDSVINSILQRRESAAILREDDVMEIQPLATYIGANDVRRLFRYSSRSFRVRATGSSHDIMASVEAVLRRERGKIRIGYWLPRRGPNIIGADTPPGPGAADFRVLGSVVPMARP
jgi:general secretion pathway protein K